MIAVDTSVLLRHLTGDDPAQSRVADRFFENELSSERPGFISSVVMLETVWALRTGFGYDADLVASVVIAMLEAPNLRIAEAESIRNALAEVGPARLADRLIHELGRAAGCSETVTFDRKFGRLPGVRLLAD